MRSFALLTGREVREISRRPAYWITTALMLALVSGAFILLPWLQHHTQTVAWALQAPNAGQKTLLERALQAAAGSQFRIRWVAPAHAAVVIRVLAGPLFAQHLAIHIHQNPAPTNGWIVQALMPAIITERLAQMPHAALFQQIMQVPTFVVHRGAHVTPPPSTAQIGITTSLVFLVFLILSIYGQMTMHSVAAEKASRLSELLSVRLSTTTLLMGKWAGVGIAAAVQIVLALIVGLGFMVFDPAAAALIHSWHLHTAPAWLWVATGAGFVFGYGFYGTLFLSLGASLARPEDARSALGLPTFGLMASYGSVMYTLAHTTTPLAHVLTMLPPFFPFLIILAQGLGTATAMEWVVGSFGTALTIGILLWWAARQYRRTLYHRAARRKPWEMLRQRPASAPPS